MQLILYLSHGKRKCMKSRNFAISVSTIFLVQFLFSEQSAQKQTETKTNMILWACNTYVVCIPCNLVTNYTFDCEIRRFVEGQQKSFCTSKDFCSQGMQRVLFSCVCFPSCLQIDRGLSMWYLIKLTQGNRRSHFHFHFYRSCDCIIPNDQI